LPVANALATGRAARSTAKKVVTVVTVTGPAIEARSGYGGSWGNLQVQLVVQKTVTKNTNGPMTVSIKITGVNWPTYPDHTPKSKYINAQALPILEQETFRLQRRAGMNLANVTGATNTTTAWQPSLQGALTLAEKPQRRSKRALRRLEQPGARSTT
jgi:hypothetical protein